MSARSLLCISSLGALVGCGAAIGAGSYLGLAFSGDDDRDPPNSVPAASFVEPVADQALNDRVRIQYLLIDGESEGVDVEVEYSIDDGDSFDPASPILDYGHDGVTGLSTSPGGTQHLFVWNSSEDVGDVDHDKVRIRIVPTDQRGLRGQAVISESFRLLNLRISTFVGGEVEGDVLIGPSGLWLDETTNRLYIADDLASKVFRLDLDTLELTRVAGNQLKGYDEDDVLATDTSLDDPSEVMLLGDQLYIGTTFRVRAVRSGTGFIKTAIGTGEAQFSGDGGVPENAAIEDQVFGLGEDAAGNIYFTDENRLRVVNRQASPITLAGTTIQPGTLETIGGAAPEQPEIWQRIVVDPTGAVVVVDEDGVWALNTLPAPLTFYPTSASPVMISPGELARIIGADGGGQTGDGVLAVQAEMKLTESGFARSGDGERYYVSTEDHRVRVVDTGSGLIRTICGNGVGANSGDGGPALTGQLLSPRDLAISNKDCLFVACTSSVRAINVGLLPLTLGPLTIAPGDIATVTSGSPGDFLVADDCLAVAPDDGVFTMDKTSSALIEIRPDTRERIVVVGAGGTYAGDGGPAVNASSSGYVLALDPAGNLVFADKGRVRVVNRQTASIVVGGVTIPPGHIDTIAGTGSEQPAGDGGPALAASFAGPEHLTVDPAGNIYLCGEGAIRVVNPNTTATTVAGVVIAPGGIETVIGTGTPGCSGDGGPPTAAECEPVGIALDPAGNIYIVDADCSTIRVVNVTPSTLVFFPGGAAVTVAPNTIETIAGSGGSSFNGDGLTTLQTAFTNPKSLLIRSTEILVCDPGSRRLRRIDGFTGIVSTLVGTGVAGFNGDAIPLENVRLAPELVTIDSRARLYVLDGTGRIRRFQQAP